jgi:hypothetical protein
LIAGATKSGGVPVPTTSKPNFQGPGIYHEMGKFRKLEKLATQYSKTFLDADYADSTD